jgi:hypothetical protein
LAPLLLSTLGLGISAADIDPGRRTGNGAWAGSAVSGAAGGLTDLTSGDVDQILARLSDSKTAGVVAGATGMSQDGKDTVCLRPLQLGAAQQRP